jgi:flagellar hook-associated protein 2
VGGLDVDALVSAQIQADTIPITQIQNRNTILQAKLNDYSSIKSNLFILNSAISDLTLSSTFTGRIATSTDDKIVTATAQNGSASGSFIIDVGGLATTTHTTSTALSFSDGVAATLTGTTDLSTAQLNLAFNDAASPYKSSIQAGSFTINNQVINVASTDTINTVLNKISASGAGVTATLKDGKILLTQNTVGATPTITLGSSDSSNFLQQMGLTPGGLVAGTDSDETRPLSATMPGIQGGYFSINGTYFSVDPNTDTLNSIINKINSSTTAGVLAFYDSTTKTISLTNQTAGDKTMTLGSYGAGTDSSDFLAKAGLASATIVPGENAKVTVNGVSVTPVGNKVTLNGNVFTLANTGKATVTVQNDVDSVVTKVQNFIQLYNTVIDLVNNKMNEKPDSSSTDPSVGDLYCDSTLESISQSLRAFSYAVVNTQPSSMQQLSQIGITTGAIGQDVSASVSGHLSLDTDKLRAALQSNPQQVASLFGNSMVSVSNEAVGTGDGNATAFTLQHGSLSGDPTVQVTYGSTTTSYTQVSTFSTDAATRATQYMLDRSTGKITFGKAPDPGATIKASYQYDVSSGSQAGIFVQMGTLLNSYSQTGGTFDAIIGSNGSITRQMGDNNDRIKEMQDRLSNEQAALYTLYQNMATQLLNLQSQGSFLTAQLASLSSSSK